MRTQGKRPRAFSLAPGDPFFGSGCQCGEESVGQGRIRTQPGKFSIAGEGLAIGKDTGEPVTADYPGQAPWRFTGGTIHRAAVDVSGEPFVDLAAEVRMAFMRD
jgi:arylsulfatase